MKKLLAVLAALWLIPAAALSQDKGAAPQARPAVVVLDEIRSGSVQPLSAFVGTVFFARVSNVAAEVDGRVQDILFEEGGRVEKGAVLAALNTDLLDLGIDQKRALYEEAQVALKKAGTDLNRMERLYREKSVAYTVYDDARFEVLQLEKRAGALKAALARDRLLRQKMKVLAPFAGLVLQKSTEVGEWVGPGSPVAVVAGDREIDVVVGAPEKILSYLAVGDDVAVEVGARGQSGRLEAVIPRGDAATRTFSVKIRLANESGLMEGMEARAMLPTGPKTEGLLVSRDAVVNQFGKDVIFVSDDGAAKMVPVKILGYYGLQVGVRGPGLAEGMKVVVKGNERLRPGQPLMPR